MSTSVATTYYIKFLNKNGDYIQSRMYQPFFPGEVRTLYEINYQYAPFGFNGSSSTRNGDGVEGTLLFPANDLSVSLATEAILQNWLVEVTTVEISIEIGGNFTECAVYSTELWACNGGGQPDLGKVVINLSSPTNAIRGRVPKRVLTTDLVGSVPSTGQISMQ